jgi:hypothetical protein
MRAPGGALNYPDLQSAPSPSLGPADYVSPAIATPWPWPWRMQSGIPIPS